MLLSGNEDALDPIVEAIHDMIEDLHDFGTGAMREVTLALVLMALGDALMWGMPVVTLGSTMAAGDTGGAGAFLLGFGANAAVTEGLKMLVHKDRPDGSDFKSFPSGHTSIAFQSASFLHLRHGLRYGAPAYAAAAFVGYSRVHARKHYVSDVLVGAALGVASSALLTERRPEDRSVPESGVSFGVRVGFGSGLALRVTGGVY